MDTSLPVTADTIIIGAGVSGLGCGYKLNQLNSSVIILEGTHVLHSFSFLLFSTVTTHFTLNSWKCHFYSFSLSLHILPEIPGNVTKKKCWNFWSGGLARDRVGGRVHTFNCAGIPVDIGACFVHGATKDNPTFKFAMDNGTSWVFPTTVTRLALIKIFRTALKFSYREFGTKSYHFGADGKKELKQLRDEVSTYAYNAFRYVQEQEHSVLTMKKNNIFIIVTIFSELVKNLDLPDMSYQDALNDYFSKSPKPWAKNSAHDHCFDRLLWEREGV